MKLLKKGSVKDIYQVNDETLCFQFSSRYSVFDWGEMPDAIDGKGERLAKITYSLFKYLESPKEWGETHLPEKYKDRVPDAISHHILSIDKEQLLVKKVDVPEVNIVNGEYDYKYYNHKPENCLIPLEVIFRLELGPNSSLYSRLKDSDYLESIGFPDDRSATCFLENPIVEFSTKLENEDRYLDYEEAQAISGCSLQEFEKIKLLAQLISLGLYSFFQSREIVLIDGKVEFAFGKKDKDGHREIILVDSIGPDELRLEYKGVALSKQIARDFLKKTDWKEKVDTAKKTANQRGEKDWKYVFCDLYPRAIAPSLKPNELKQFRDIYSVLESVICLDKEAGREKLRSFYREYYQ